MKIFIACDHGGIEYKNSIKKLLAEQNIITEDFGTNEAVSVDYPDYAQKVCKAVQANPGSRGILICGTGIGMSISANKFQGIRAALVSDCFSAEATRKHNDTNVLCLGQRVIDEGLALKITDIWLNTEYEEGRHRIRVEKIGRFEN